MIKRKLALLLLCVLSGSVLVSCGGKEEETKTAEPETAQTEVSVETETGVLKETESIPGTEQETSEPDALSERELTEEELLFFTNYLSRIDNYGFLLSEYAAPAEINLEEVFYSGAGIQMQPMTEQEKEAYMKAAGQNEIFTDVVHLSSAQIDNFLMEKTGISNKDMDTPLPWLYVPEYDTYYHEAGDTNYVFLYCEDGSVINEKYYTLHVQTENGYAAYQEGVCELVLEKSGNGYRFVSNKVIPSEADEAKSDTVS